MKNAGVWFAAFILFVISMVAMLGQMPAVNTPLASSGLATSALTATTGSIGGGLLAAGACATGTVAVTNSTTAMTVAVSPNTYPGDGSIWYGYVSANGTVTVKACGLVAITPTSSTYNVQVR